MNEIILIKNGEMALKGLNRSSFEDTLIRTLRKSLQVCGQAVIRKAQSTIYIEPKENFDFERACELVSKTFGIAGFSRAAVCEKSLQSIQETACVYFESVLSGAKTFKVEAKRSDKQFPLKSPELAAEVGGALLSRFPHLKVDVKQPEVTVYVEIRDFGAYVHGAQIKGAGGIPVGTGGRAAILISGGIDSPVAAWMMAKRGIQLTAVHFASPPYTSQLAELKVKDLLRKVGVYAGTIALFTVPFTEIQEAISEQCPEEFFTVIMRRFMMRVSQKIAKKRDCGALITGESLGQVASQTIGAIRCTDQVCELPVFRPLIGMDKEEIVSISRKIDTFDISIRPYEDCCTVFTPRHPRTRPHLHDIEQAESVLNIEELVERAASSAVFELIEQEESF